MLRNLVRRARPAVLGLILLGAAPRPSFAEERLLTLDEALRAAAQQNPLLLAARENAVATGYRISEVRATSPSGWPSVAVIQSRMTGPRAVNRTLSG